MAVENNKTISSVMGGHPDNQNHCFNFGFLILAFLIYLVIDSFNYCFIEMLGRGIDECLSVWNFMK